MGLNFPATITCDKCGSPAAVDLEVTSLKPQVAMHLKLPDGWVASSKPESAELLTTCPNCPPVLVSVPPAAVSETFMDPTTDPTLRPPPLPKI